MRPKCRSLRILSLKQLPKWLFCNNHITSFRQKIGRIGRKSVLKRNTFLSWACNFNATSSITDEKAFMDLNGR